MSPVAGVSGAPGHEAQGGRRFAFGFALFTLGSATLTGALPVQASFMAVLLFAGPHNLMEARYALSRLPSRLGPLRSYFTVSVVGTLSLAAVAVVLPAVARLAPGARGSLGSAAAVWNLALIGWLVWLVGLRSREGQGRDWGWVYGAGCLLAALVCWRPAMWSLALVFAHPLVALVMLDREIRTTRRAWLPAYRAALLTLPGAIAALYAWLGAAGPLPREGDDALTMRLVAMTGGLTIPMSTHFLVASYVLLELVHYYGWIVAMPSVARLGTIARPRAPWFARNGSVGQVHVLLAAGAMACIGLWVGFGVDYVWTRDLYFTVAIVHVLAEFPLLIRLL